MPPSPGLSRRSPVRARWTSPPPWARPSGSAEVHDQGVGQAPGALRLRRAFEDAPPGAGDARGEGRQIGAELHVPATRRPAGARSPRRTGAAARSPGGRPGTRAVAGRPGRTRPGRRPTRRRRSGRARPGRLPADGRPRGTGRPSARIRGSPSQASRRNPGWLSSQAGPPSGRSSGSRTT